MPVATCLARLLYVGSFREGLNPSKAEFFVATKKMAGISSPARVEFKRK